MSEPSQPKIAPQLAPDEAAPDEAAKDEGESTPVHPPRASDQAAPSAGPPRRRSKRVDKLIGTLLAGKYKILKKIGEGGMGSVYIANQEPIDRKVAVKVLLSKLAEDEISVKRFEQEARAISKMQHPNTVTIYDFGQVEADDGADRLYIVMEYLKGHTLTQVLRKEGALPGPRASRIMRQVCASLADAHGAGIIHRDLKPDNIFLSELGGEKDWVKVLDFGVAKLADSESAGTLTQTGMIFGTPKYMSPEQAEGKPIDYRADIYALGVVLYELLSGKPPFISDTPVGLLLKHISEPPRPLREAAAERDVDPRLEAIVLRALEKHPDRRQQQVTELAAELEQYERAVTGPQAIPTDVGRLAGPFRGGPAGLPTEVVPGTLPGQPVSPSGLVPPDHVPPDLSAGVSGATSTPEGFGAGPSGPTGVADVEATGPASLGHTALAPPSRPDTIGSGLSGSFSGSLDRPRRSRAGWVAAGIGVVAVSGAVAAAYGLKGSTAPTVERLVTAPGADAPPLKGEPMAAEPSSRTPLVPATPAGDEEQTASAEPGREAPGRPERTPGRDRPERTPGRDEPPAPAPTPGRDEARAPSRLAREVDDASSRLAPPAERAATVAIRLRSKPPGATVKLAGKQVGITPTEVPVPRGDDLLTFVFEKKGFLPKEQIATSARDAEVRVELQRRPRRLKAKSPVRPRDEVEPAEQDPLDLRVDDLK